MSVKETIILNRKDLKYLLLDSLRIYSDNVVFLDGNNPYKISINKRIHFILIKNVHESGANRLNQDECRIQISKSSNFNKALSASSTVIVLGYYADKKVFTAWNPFLLNPRFNRKDTISVYSRFSVQETASTIGISTYKDTENQNIISFKPSYLGLYLENLDKIHLLNERSLLELIQESDKSNLKNQDQSLNIEGKDITITHTRYSRDPRFRKKVYDAYDYKCAMCGMQLELIEAAHIVPHSHEKGTDDISNGICLCVLHHKAYDNSLIYFNSEYKIKINESKMDYMCKLGLDSGLHILQKSIFESISLPKNHIFQPDIENIKLGNSIRGIN